MAAAVKAINAKIRSNPYVSYVCSTHFWGPVSNFGIPVAAVMDTQKSPEIISGTMTGALILYSGTFMRYALAVTPKNYLLFGCHLVNFGAQNTQMYRFLSYRNSDAAKAKDAADKAAGKAEELADKAKAEVSGAVKTVEGKIAELKK